MTNPLVLTGLIVVVIVAGFVLSYAIGKTVDKKRLSKNLDEKNTENK